MLKTPLLILILLTSQAFAQVNDKKVGERDNDKLDIKKLEEKYWSAKDDDFNVVQNRRYIKAARYYLTVSGGIPFNDPYSKGTILSGHLGYFLNERWGMEASYNTFSLQDNDAVGQFVGTYGAIPNHNILKNSYYLSGIWVPFYAKMSVLDTSIIYFDMGVSAGVGSLNYNITQKEGPISKDAFSLKLGIFQQIFFSEHFAFRVDLENTWSTQSKSKYYAPNTSIAPGLNSGSGARDLGSETINDTSLIFGLTYWH